METFWKLLAETAARDRFHTHERAYYEKMFVALAGGQHRNAAMRLWLAEREGAAIAGALTVEFGGTVTYLHGASRNEDRKYMAPYLMHWHIISDAKARGFREYDLWGTAPTEDEKHPWAGITRFKVGFGGADAAYLGAWELPVNRFWYGAYRLAKRLRGAH
jgi:lipid II:glycine glycyltransferase (peptidoglycan interpeptide bridge formation enzyme)